MTVPARVAAVSAALRSIDVLDWHGIDLNALAAKLLAEADAAVDPSVIPLNVVDELRLSSTMIRRWIPEVFPADALGRVHFVRAMVESVADVIDRAIPPVPKPEAQT